MNSAIDWETISAVSEFVAALGVIVSLLYLAAQVRSGISTARTSTYQAVVSDFGALNASMAETPELSMLYVKGMEDFDALSEEEKARLSQLLFASFHYFENMYYQHRKGYLEDDVWIGWKRLMLSYFSRPGFQTWWQIRRQVFSPSFAEFLESSETDQAVPSYYAVTQLKGSR